MSGFILFHFRIGIINKKERQNEEKILCAVNQETSETQTIEFNLQKA